MLQVPVCNPSLIEQTIKEHDSLLTVKQIAKLIRMPIKSVNACIAGLIDENAVIVNPKDKHVIWVKINNPEFFKL